MLVADKIISPGGTKERQGGLLGDLKRGRSGPGENYSAHDRTVFVRPAARLRARIDREPGSSLWWPGRRLPPSWLADGSG